MKTCLVYTDGAARGNPGPAGAGWVVCDAAGTPLFQNKKFLGERTNNQAEYQALLLALAELRETVPPAESVLKIFLDSELVVRQLKGEYKVKNEGLKPLFRETVLTLSRFSGYSIQHIPREQNRRADQLANEAMDDYLNHVL